MRGLRLLGSCLLLAACDPGPSDGAVATTMTAATATTSPATTAAALTTTTATAIARTSAAALASASNTPSPTAEPCRDLVAADPAPPTPDKPEYLHGVDASSPAAWKAIRDTGYAFAFAQAALGSAPNASFRDNWRAMKACGLRRGAYHFLSANADGAAQAKVLVAQLGDDRGELPPAFDLEKPPTCKQDCCDKPCSFWTGLVRSYIAELERSGIDKLIVYAVEPFFNECLCGTRSLSRYPLWLAAWPKFDWPEKVVTGGFERWTFYQHKGNVRAGAGVIDLNVFRGTLADLDALATSERR